MAESAFRQSMLISQGSLSIFWSNWLVGSICLLAITVLFWPLISRFFDRKPGSAPAIGE